MEGLGEIIEVFHVPAYGAISITAKAVSLLTQSADTWIRGLHTVSGDRTDGEHRW